MLSWLAGEPLLLTVWHLKLSNESIAAAPSPPSSPSVTGEASDEVDCWSTVQDRPRKLEGRIRKASKAMLADT